MTQRKHHKRRNVGLMYDFVVRHIVDCVLRDDDKGAQAGVDVIRRNFKPGTELYKEWRLFNALVKTKGVDETSANAIVRETRRAVRAHDAKRLDEEKTLLIHDVNKSMGQGVYERIVPDYRFFATVQTLFNDWRDTGGMPDIQRIAEYEKSLRDTLMEQTLPTIEEERTDPAEDALVVKLMTEKLNKRYAGKLNVEQRRLLGAYALNGITTELVSELHRLRDETLTLMDAYAAGLAPEDAYTKKKLTEAKSTVSTLDEVDDASFPKYLRLCELKEELKS